MGSLSDAMSEYRAQMQKGAIQQAYRGLMEYMSALKTQLKAKYPEYQVSGSLYFGYMDMTYFSFTPPALKDKGLKIAIVFVHETFAFEVWLSAANRAVLAQYAQLIEDAGWEKYPRVDAAQNPDAILEHTITADPDFSNLLALSAQIERETLAFCADVETFLSTVRD
ncbi:DUF7000 family protein [Pelolinea submarina]|uniref:DUF7000 domain-containing protein n=1 Tax=Pelolinea submarina TaxID=913107 RepID=A0A347ZPC4_9CHLR|nr:hypothetical protein [Pelolinea submarina]REG08757.1 hypothetical protein DFR64_2132 [Pelolinea submarina]BBB47155.1 hypothetical protein Pelsub_P0382 [Pelolinea submarina]